MKPIEPSGIFCSSCQKEIDLFDGPVKRIGKPMQFPFCNDCWVEFYRSGYVQQCDIVVEDVGEELHIWMRDAEEERKRILARSQKLVEKTNERLKHDRKE
jgi:hypothetical protein